MSTGLGCPHAETDPDFLGLMVAFRTANGRRIDFVTINDPTSPTDTPEEFLALLKATADAAGATGLLALADEAARRTGAACRASGRRPLPPMSPRQTHRTVRSSSAYQQVLDRDRSRAGCVRQVHVRANRRRVRRGVGSRGPTHLTNDWRARQSAGPLVFDLQWIPFLDDSQTSLDDLTRPWAQDHAVSVGTVTFPKIDPNSVEAKLTALLASELGANPGNWQETAEEATAPLPATRFTGCSTARLPREPENTRRVE